MKPGRFAAHWKVSSAEAAVFWSRIRRTIWSREGTTADELEEYEDDDDEDDEMGLERKMRREIRWVISEHLGENLEEPQSLSMEDFTLPSDIWRKTLFLSVDNISGRLTTKQNTYVSTSLTSTK